MSSMAAGGGCDLPAFNFQVSEAARVLTLIYIASYAVRFESALRSGLSGLARPIALLSVMALLLLLEPDFGAATVLFVTGFGVLYLAGARLRYVLAMVLAAGGSMVLLVIFSSYRMRRMTTFLDPWADPFKSGFQLTQSLIAIGRGELFGVGLGPASRSSSIFRSAYRLPVRRAGRGARTVRRGADTGTLSGVVLARLRDRAPRI